MVLALRKSAVRDWEGGWGGEEGIRSDFRYCLAHFEVFFVKHFPTHCRLRPYRFGIVLGCLCVRQRAIYITHHCERTLRCSAAQTFPKQRDRLQTHSFTISNVAQINDRLGSHVLRAKRASKSQSQNVSCNLGVCLRIDLTDKTVHFC